MCMYKFVCTRVCFRVCTCSPANLMFFPRHDTCSHLQSFSCLFLVSSQDLSLDVHKLPSVTRALEAFTRVDRLEGDNGAYMRMGVRGHLMSVHILFEHPTYLLFVGACAIILNLMCELCACEHFINGNSISVRTLCHQSHCREAALCAPRPTVSDHSSQTFSIRSNVWRQ